MKKSDIIAMVNGGLLNATQHELGTAHSYKVFKLKSEVRKVNQKIADDEEALRKENGIEDAAAFDERLNVLRGLKSRTTDEEKELADMLKKMDGYFAQRELLLDEEVTLDGIKKIPYEAWRTLQDENREVDFMGHKTDVFSGLTEDVLFGILWEAPADDEE